MAHEENLDSEARTNYAKLFEGERADWKERIAIVSLDMKDIRTISKAQVDLFTNRQLLLEYSYKLASIISKLNSKLRIEKAKKLKDYTEKSDFRYGANEKNTLIDGELSTIIERIELVDGHRKFIDQTVQTVDHMLYAIKNRIALEEYMRGTTIK